jgi:hypothetical protein
MAIAAMLAGGRASAQCTPGGPPNPAAVKGAIVGIVMDSAHAALDNATVLIRQPRREAQTNERGFFQLTDLEPGTYELVVRRIGYELALQQYIVTDSGGVARFCLFPDPQGLAPMITSVPRGGLSGVIGDTTYATVSGAEVRIVGGGKWTLSDSAGGFYLPVEKGTYGVLVKKAGYGDQIVSVTIPNDSGRRIAVWLGSRKRNANTLSWAIEGMRQNVMLTPAHRYHQLSAEELAKTDMNITQAVRVAGKTNVSDDCEARIAGSIFTLPLYMLNKEEIMMLEIIGAPLTRRSGAPRGVTSINGNQNIPLQGLGSRLTQPWGCPGVVAWMKP